MILEEEVGLPPAPKEPVPVPFICNLRGFGCPLSADTISPSPWYIGCKLAKEERELVLSQEVCTTQEPGQAMGKMCVVFRSSNTKDALLSLLNICSCSFSVQRGREVGAFLARKAKPARGLHQRQLIKGERIGKDRSSPPLDSISK